MPTDCGVIILAANVAPAGGGREAEGIAATFCCAAIELDPDPLPCWPAAPAAPVELSRALSAVKTLL